MRCQKCGFISFDQPSCSKCGADQTGKSSYSGTGQKTDPPFFLAAALGDTASGAATAMTAAAVIDIQEEEARDGSAALFEALEEESQGIIIAEEPQELDLSFEQPEDEEAEEEAEEISLVIPEQEEPSLAIEEEEEEPAAPAPAEESLELSLEIPEQHEEAEAAPAAAPKEAQEITLEIQAEEPPAPAQAEPAEEAETSRQDPESLDLSETKPSSVDLQEIDLSDLVADTSSAPVKAADSDEIFDLSALMDDPGEEQGPDEFTLTMDVSDTTATDTEKAEPVAKKPDTLSGLTLESEE